MRSSSPDTPRMKAELRIDVIKGQVSIQRAHGDGVRVTPKMLLESIYRGGKVHRAEGFVRLETEIPHVQTLKETLIAESHILLEDVNLGEGSMTHRPEGDVVCVGSHAKIVHEKVAILAAATEDVLIDHRVLEVEEGTGDEGLERLERIPRIPH